MSVVSSDRNRKSFIHQWPHQFQSHQTNHFSLHETALQASMDYPVSKKACQMVERWQQKHPTLKRHASPYLRQWMNQPTLKWKASFYQKYERAAVTTVTFLLCTIISAVFSVSCFWNRRPCQTLGLTTFLKRRQQRLWTLREVSLSPQ
eukprot:m.72883 g.72883  ORF g.72883 m.72883 type:complete len:148 (+) comp35819_c0_seq10:886-1329(+)